MKKSLIAVAVLIAALVALAFIAPAFINWNDYKPEIAAQARAATGRELNIDGDISLRLLPMPIITVEALRFANLPGAVTPDMAVVESLEVQVALGPLVSGEIDELTGAELRAGYEAEAEAVESHLARSAGLPAAGHTRTRVAAGAAFLGVATVLSKSFLEGDIFWLYLGAYRLGFGLAMAGITVVTREVRTGMRVTLRNSAFLRLIILEEGVLISVAMVVRFAAINLGPVSLVSALNSAQPAMVFIYSLLLAGLFPLAFGNWVTKRTLHTQTVGIAVIVGAVAIISLE